MFSSLGVDLVDQRRFALAARRTGPAWLRRIFDDTEWAVPDRDQVPDAAELAHLGRLFGIKECVVKAAGGLPAGARYRDIIVHRADADGVRPIGLRGELGRWAAGHGVVMTGGTIPDPPAPDLDLCWAAATEAEEAR